MKACPWISIFRLKPKFDTPDLRNLTVNFEYVRKDIKDHFIGEIQIEYTEPEGEIVQANHWLYELCRAETSESFVNTLWRIYWYLMKNNKISKIM